MNDEKLKSILENTDLHNCEPIINDYIYYCKKPIKSRASRSDGTYGYYVEEYEFLIIADHDEKKGIIFRCGTTDLHWFVLKKWRNHHVLSNALRTGVIHDVWPENTTISCCYSWRDKMVDRPQKYAMTKHLAALAGLNMK